MNLYVGTSGYSYKEWKGNFYPSDLPGKLMLNYYADRFRTVEINNTFYRMPGVSVLETWAADVPADFRFVLKAPRQITHIKRLKDAGDSVSYLLEVAETLKERLGPLLFQLPPNLKKDVPRLRAFLALLQPQFRTAFEFRHQYGSTKRSSGCCAIISLRCVSPRRRTISRFLSWRPGTGAICVCAGPTTAMRS
ncbi:MAG: DUF72 domain-containing protein [Syntrophobacteraceae bacterium]